MASQKQILCLCVLASYMITLATAGNIFAEVHKQLISRICDHTDHPPLCLSTITPYLKGSGHIDLQTVLRFSVEAGHKYAMEALAHVKKLASTKDATREMKGTLKDCKSSYSTAVENFSKTLTAMTHSDIGTMKSVLSAIITFVSDCEDEFTQMQEHSPMSPYANKLIAMTSNCLAIVAQVHHH